jgi:hypothetical protein
MYDDAWMPNMQRITWNGVALHGGPLPGYAASHGCVRMPFGFAEKLFDKTRIGMRVIISPNDAEPVEFSHPALFVPKPDAIAAAPAKAEALAREAEDAAKAADETKKAAAKAPRETAVLTASLRKLQGLKTRADAELATADKVLAAAGTDEARARAEERKQKAATRATELGTQLDSAQADAKPKLDAAAAAKDAAKAAQTRKADTAKAASFASDALDRITFPLDVLDRIAPTAMPRSSIIVSDEPLSAETNYRTEFVAVLSNQPQGGFITRKPTVNVEVASDAGFGFGSFFQGNWDSQGNRLGDPRRRPSWHRMHAWLHRRRPPAPPSVRAA